MGGFGYYFSGWVYVGKWIGVDFAPLVMLQVS